MRDEIALVPSWDACHVTNPSADSAAVVRGMGDATAVWPIHAIDCKTNKMLLTADYPNASDYPAFRGIAGNPFKTYKTACKLVTNSSHAPAFSALSDQPDLYADWTRQLIAYATTKYQAQTGLAIDQQADSTGYKNHGYAPWQMHYLVSALGYVIQLGYTEAQWLLDYFGGPVLDSMDKAQHELATTYNNCMRHADGTMVQTWAEGLKAREEYTTPGTGGQFGPAAARQNAAAENSDEMQLAIYGVAAGSPVPSPYKDGDMSGYPVSASGMGYPAILRTGLAPLADHATDKARAQAVWTKFMQYDRTSYATGPSCNLVPRTTAA
jgi:hypothetical protein